MALTLVAGVSLHSCAGLPSGRELAAAGARLQTFFIILGTAVRQQASQASGPAANTGSARAPAPAPAAAGPARTAGTNGAFSACPQFTGGHPPVVKARPSQHALCYDAFAILHSGESKTAVYVAQKLNRALIEDADEERGDRFLRLLLAERAMLADYVGSGLDKGHLVPANQMPTAQVMAQSFSLANMVPQALSHNRGVWRNSVELTTRKYAAKASGDVYVITGSVYAPSIAKSKAIGLGQVRVPKYLGLLQVLARFEQVPVHRQFEKENFIGLCLGWTGVLDFLVTYCLKRNVPSR